MDRFPDTPWVGPMNGIPMLRLLAVLGLAASACNYKYPGDVGADGGDVDASDCGNNRIDEGEDCDRTIIEASCFSIGLIEGELGCTDACRYDTSGCHDCGNGALEGPEICDGTFLDGASCQSRGFDDGVLGCAPNCLTFDESACTDCGNNVREGAENCDGDDLGTASCSSLGFAGGTLVCSACAFDTTGCDANLPTVPRLRLPMTDRYQGSINVAGSLRPTFAWEASSWSGSGTVAYDLQYSADPTFSIGTVTASSTMTSHRPTADLPVRTVAPVGTRYFWRVRACVGAACSAYSPAWKVNLGRSDRDVNGDGFADIVAGAPGNDAGGAGAGRVYLYLGGPGPTLDYTADATLTGFAAGDAFGGSVAVAGDVNGDGFADLVVGAAYNSAGGAQAGRAYVFLGGAGSFDTTPDGILTGAATMDSFGASVAGAGDVNGDGFADVVVGANQTMSAPGRAYVFFGGAGTSFDQTPDATMSGETNGNYFGYSVSGAGDTNGDGYHDVIVGAFPYGSSAGRAYVFLGGPGAFNAAADSFVTGSTANDWLGISVAGAGDLNADGFADVVVGAEGNDIGGTYAGQVYVYFGSAGDSLDVTPDGTLTGAAGEALGRSVASAGDVNGDGYADVIVGAFLSGPPSQAGKAYVYLGGGGTTFNATADGTLTGSAVADDAFGRTVASAGDVNGDGFADVVAGAPNNGSTAAYAGRIYAYFGGAGTSFNPVVDGSPAGAAMNDNFGASVH